MTSGTIHAVDEHLFLVEGEWPVWPAVAMPGPAVFRAGRRLYLLDTGAGPRLRSAVRAVTASFGQVAEVVLINSGGHPGLVGNNDVIDGLPAAAYRYLRPPAFDPPAGWSAAVAAAYPPVRPTSVPAQDLCVPAATVPVSIGGVAWSGWSVGDGLTAIEVTGRSRRLAFYLRDRRALLLPDELALAPEWPGSDVSDVLRVGALALRMIGAGAVEVLGLGFGAPLDPRSAQDAIEALMDRARLSRAATELRSSDDSPVGPLRRH